jgi:hypothetical protein
MEVMGIYKRGSVPRESELPEDYVLKDCQQDQVMVRQRLRTRPLFDDDDDDEHHLIDADSDIDDDGDDGSEADDESDGGDQTSKGQGGSEQKRKKTKKSKKERLSRRFRRLLRSKADGTEYDVAMFQPEEGLVMKESDWPFFHADLSEHSDSSDDERVSSFGKIVNLHLCLLVLRCNAYQLAHHIVCQMSLNCGPNQTDIRREGHPVAVHRQL